MYYVIAELMDFSTTPFCDGHIVYDIEVLVVAVNEQEREVKFSELLDILVILLIPYKTEIAGNDEVIVFSQLLIVKILIEGEDFFPRIVK